MGPTAKRNRLRPAPDGNPARIAVLLSRGATATVDNAPDARALLAQHRYTACSSGGKPGSKRLYMARRDGAPDKIPFARDLLGAACVGKEIRYINGDPLDCRRCVSVLLLLSISPRAPPHTPEPT